jgi:undecaprenyl phosphate-alpha-L-ara4FN deformylase
VLDLARYNADEAMTSEPHSCSLKVDVDTHEGMRDGVPCLLETFKVFGVQATFYLSFGPDNAGKAIWNLFRRKGFLKKMIRTGAINTYGWRTTLSGTLLPARMIAKNFPDLVRRIRDEGHEIGVHAWDHRLWQDHLERLSRLEIAGQFARAFDAFEEILGERAETVASPAWYSTRTSLEVEDALSVLYASDTRGGPPCFVEYDGTCLRTLQIPTTQPCLEELLTLGRRDVESNVETVLTASSASPYLVVPLHAEVEGGAQRSFLVALLERLHDRGLQVRPLRDLAKQALSAPERPPTLNAYLREIPGRTGRVLTCAPPEWTDSSPNRAQLHSKG